MRTWLIYLSAGVLAFLGSIDPPSAHAQMRYDGGFVLPNRSSYRPLPPPRYEPFPAMRFDVPVLPSYATPPPAQVVTLPVSRSVVAEAPYRIPTAALPWGQPGFVAYDEARPAVWTSTPGPATDYRLTAVSLSRRVATPDPSVVVLVAHLPENASLWIEGKRTLSLGKTRYFESPPLTPGKRYRYTLYAAWFESGNMVGQALEVPVKAGRVAAVYLVRSGGDQVRTNLAKLSPEDREVAARQKFCVVREEVRLGETGIPVKVMIQGHRVFVSDPTLVEKVQADPERTWRKAQALRAQSTPPVK